MVHLLPPTQRSMRWSTLSLPLANSDLRATSSKQLSVREQKDRWVRWYVRVLSISQSVSRSTIASSRDILTA